MIEKHDALRRSANLDGVFDLDFSVHNDVKGRLLLEGPCEGVKFDVGGFARLKPERTTLTDKSQNSSITGAMNLSNVGGGCAALEPGAAAISELSSFFSPKIIAAKNVATDILV